MITGTARVQSQGMRRAPNRPLSTSGTGTNRLVAARAFASDRDYSSRNFENRESGQGQALFRIDRQNRGRPWAFDGAARRRLRHHFRAEPSWAETRVSGTREGTRRRGKGGRPHESGLNRALSEYSIAKRGAPTEKALRYTLQDCERGPGPISGGGTRSRARRAPELVGRYPVPYRWHQGVLL